MNTVQRYANKIVLVTGGSSGSKLATAQEFEREGARVILTGSDDIALASASEALGTDATVVKVDIANIDDIDCLMESIVQWHGRIDILVAGIEAGELDVTARKALPLLGRSGSTVAVQVTTISAARPSVRLQGSSRVARPVASG
jgi:NADP-dependent 3-hydroxy acid dehydrogenase YdfG